MQAHPLVSILVPNFNYGKYLGSALESALAQTYDNLQVVFVDNNSTDDSYDIAMDFQARHKDRLRIFRNRDNIGGSPNHARAYNLMDPRTQCYIYLSSDDLFHPTLVERSLSIMTGHPSVGFVIVHRNAIDEHGTVTEEMPFYNCSCVIPSTRQMEVFMMAGIGVCTQCFRHRISEATCGIRGYNFDVSGDWFSNFCMATNADMGYIDEPLCSYRTHASNVTSNAVRNLTNSIDHILMLQAFNDIALRLERPSVSLRLKPALEKLGTMCLRYCTTLLQEGDVYTATRYLHLAPVLRVDIREDPTYQDLWSIVRLPAGERALALAEFEIRQPQKRRVSYDPPEGSIRL